MIEFLKYRSYLVLAAGGGGDVVSAVLLANILMRHGYRAHVGTVIWERFVVDPVPGPARLDEIREPIRRGDHYLVIDGDAYMNRGGRRIRFQAARVADYVEDGIAVFELEGGVAGYARGVSEYIRDHGVEAVIGIDVGGDILAKGDEENLWSPLMDSATLALLSLFRDSILAVHSPGADGELSQNYVLERISMVYRKGGGLGARGLTKDDADLLEKLTSKAITEAGRIPLLAFKGYYGWYPIRGGTRRVFVSPVNTITFFMYASKAYSLSPPAEMIRMTDSFTEIVEVMNKAGIYTEYNLEVDIMRHGGTDPRRVEEIRRRGIRRIRKG